MANYTADDGDQAVHAKTLTPDEEDVVTLGVSSDEVEVLVHALGSEPVYFTINDSEATVEGGNTYVLASPGALRLAVPYAAKTKVRLISAAAATYSVTGI